MRVRVQLREAQLFSPLQVESVARSYRFSARKTQAGPPPGLPASLPGQPFQSFLRPAARVVLPKKKKAISTVTSGAKTFHGSPLSQESVLTPCLAFRAFTPGHTSLPYHIPGLNAPSKSPKPCFSLRLPRDDGCQLCAPITSRLSERLSGLEGRGCRVWHQLNFESLSASQDTGSERWTNSCCLKPQPSPRCLLPPVCPDPTSLRAFLITCPRLG